MCVFNGGQWHFFVYSPPMKSKKKIIVMAKLKCIIFTKFQSLVLNILKIGFKSHQRLFLEKQLLYEVFFESIPPPMKKFENMPLVMGVYILTIKLNLSINITFCLVFLLLQ